VKGRIKEKEKERHIFFLPKKMTEKREVYRTNRDWRIFSFSCSPSNRYTRGVTPLLDISSGCFLFVLLAAARVGCHVSHSNMDTGMYGEMYKYEI